MSVFRVFSVIRVGVALFWSNAGQDQSTIESHGVRRVLPRERRLGVLQSAGRDA